MKVAILALAGSAAALVARMEDTPEYFNQACCKNVVTTTVYGSMPPPTWTASSSTAKKSSSSSTWKASTSAWSKNATWAGPTPYVTTCKETGVYTIPDKTVTVTETKTTYVKTSATLTEGWNTYGGWSTTVTGATTVTVPWEHKMTKSASATGAKTVTKVETSITYVCPSAGTWTVVPPETTSVLTKTVVVYPVPVTVTPGTYTRKVTTVTATVTDEVFLCPYEGVWTTKTVTVVPTPVWTEPATTPAWTEPATTPAWTEPATTPAWTEPATTPAWTETAWTEPATTPAWTEPAWTAPAASSYTAAKPSGSGGEVKVNGNKWAITYTPYTESGECKSADAVKSDLAGIAAKGFTTVRLYATDCSGLENVGTACEAYGLKIILGIFIDNKGIGAAQQQVSDIAAWGGAGHWATVSMIVVGNEAIFNGYCSAEELASFISSSKASWVSGGYGGTVTTTEPLNILQASGGALCGVIDVVAANIQPFFNSQITASQAGDFVASQLWAVGQVCPGKDAYNLECGWPSAGNANGAAVPGVQEQKDALTSIMSQVGDKTVFFSFANDYWKAEGSFGVEQSFGCSDLF